MRCVCFLYNLSPFTLTIKSSSVLAFDIFLLFHLLW